MVFSYEPGLKDAGRRLRRNMTDAEQRLWNLLRRKQILGVPFYRQRPIGRYVVDFYCPRAKLVVEVDGGQHYSAEGARADERRSEFLRGLGLSVLRFDNREVLTSPRVVVAEIAKRVDERINPV